MLPDPIKALFQVSSFKLQATELGIRKIDLGDSGGHISFDPKPNIDPMLIIQLIQQQPNIYKLDQKNNKLRIAKNLEERQERINQLEELFRHFQNKD